MSDRSPSAGTTAATTNASPHAAQSATRSACAARAAASAPVAHRAAPNPTTNASGTSHASRAAKPSRNRSSATARRRVIAFLRALAAVRVEEELRDRRARGLALDDLAARAADRRRDDVVHLRPAAHDVVAKSVAREHLVEVAPPRDGAAREKRRPRRDAADVAEQVRRD